MATAEDNIQETATAAVEDNIQETATTKVKDDIPAETAMEEWMDEENDNVSGELEDSSGLETKRRRQIKVNKDIPAVVVEVHADEDKSNGEDNRGHYFDECEGSKDLTTDSSSSTSTESEFFVAEKELGNGNSALKEIMNDLQIVPGAGARQDLNHIKMGNGLNSYITSVDNVEDEIVATKRVTLTHAHDGIAKEVKLDVSELDLEKVLEEQETHDLFCPNCNSCITKRVILRKRKRRVHDFEHEERPGKLHVTPNIVSTSVESVEIRNVNEPDVFRCLSCFSYFSPTENGFNVFRIFRKRGDTVSVQVPNVQSSVQTSDRDGSRLSSILKPDSSKNKENEAETVLPGQSHMSSDIPYHDQNNQTSPILTTSETPSYTDNAYSTNLDAENGFNVFRIFRSSGDTVSVQVPNVQSSVQTSDRDGSRLSSILKPDSGKKKENEAGTVLPGQSHMSSDIPYPDQNNQTFPVLTTSEAASYTDNAYSTNLDAENGFNIFRIFRRSGDTVSVHVPNVQSSVQTSAWVGSWLSSIFKQDSSKKKENEAGQSHMSSDIPYHDQNNQTSPVLTTSEAASYTDNAYSTNLDAAVQFPAQLGVSFGGDSKLEEHQSIASLPIPISFGTEESHANNENINSETQSPVKIKVSFGGHHMLNENKIASTPPTFDATSTGGSNTTNLNIITGDGEIKPVIITKPAISGRTEQNNHDAVEIITPATILLPQENYEIKPIVTFEPSPHGTSQTDLSITISAPPPTVFVPLGDVHINVGDQILEATGEEKKWEVLKSIVYGGLVESITSLGVVSSAAGAETSTLNIVAIGLANLVGGFFVILHDLSELKSTAAANQKDEPNGRYWKLLGRKSNFRIHATVAIISYILFGLLPAVIYGFSFRKSDNKEYKIIAVAASSLLCITLLAIGKAHVSEPRSYSKTFLYYIGLGCTASGLSYVAGVMIDRFLDQLGLFKNDAPLPAPPSINLFGTGSGWVM